MDWEWIPTEDGEFVDTAHDEWVGLGITGKVCWGHSNVDEGESAQELNSWSKSGVFASGSGDDEVLYFYANGEAISPPWNLGIRKNARITLNKYNSGDTPETILYRTAATAALCVVAAWIPYTGLFDSLGWVQIRLVNGTTTSSTTTTSSSSTTSSTA